MKSESTIQSEIRIALSDYGIVFRTNAGDFWQGAAVYSKEFKQNVLINMRRVQGLPEGFTDLLFIGDDLVAFIETKNATRQPTTEQLNFIDMMQQRGHRAGIARSVADAMTLIQGEGTIVSNTRADAIRAMTDEQLADFIIRIEEAGLEIDYCDNCQFYSLSAPHCSSTDHQDCINALVSILKADAEEATASNGI